MSTNTVADDTEAMIPKDDVTGNDEVVVEQPKSCCSRVRSIITVEPVVYLYFVGFVSYLPTLQQYIYAEIGREHGMEIVSSAKNCSQNSSSGANTVENEVQSESSEFMLIVTAVALLPGFVMTLFLGHYSDHKGRKIALMLPLAGGTIRAFISVAVVHFQLNRYILVAAAVVDSCSGGIMAIIMASFAYIADISTMQTRSIRILVLEVALGLGIATSTIATGYIIRIFHFEYSFLFGLTAHALNAVFTMLYIKETVTSREDVSFFSTGHIIETFRLYTRDDETHRRWKLIVMLFLVILICTVDIGSADVTTFFLLDRPLCFSSVMIGYYQAATYLMKGFTGLVLMVLLKNLLGDSGLMILGCLAGIASQLMLAFSHNIIMVFAVPLIAASESLILPLCRALSSKLVHPKELGSLFAAIAFGQQLSSFLGGIIFNSMYSKTVYFFVGTPFIVAAGLFVIALGFALALNIGIRRQTKADNEVAYGPIN